MKGKHGNVGLILMLFVALLLPSRSMAQFRMWQGGLFGMGPLSEEIMEEEEYIMYYGYRGGLFNPTGNGYNIGTQHFGSDENGGFNITTQVFGQEMPLGSGLLIMLGAGTVYAVKKRKRK